MIRLPTVVAALAAALFATAAIAADDYPNKPIHVYTSSAAGGLSDTFLRALSEEMRKTTGQSLVIENKPGAAGNIAARVCTEGPPDGYTICILNTDTLAFNQFLFKKLPFEPDKLVPIINLFHLIQVLVVNADLKVKNVDELVALSKAKPGTLNYLTASLPLVVYMDRLKKEKGADWVRVPFRGGGQATSAILGGSTPIGLIGLGNVLTNIEAGKMTALVLANNIRTPLQPNVPTLADIGYTGAPSTTWYGLFAPAGTPKPVIDKLNAVVRKIMGGKEFLDKHVISRSMVPALNSPEEFAAEIKEDRKVAEQVVKDAGMQPQ